MRRLRYLGRDSGRAVDSEQVSSRAAMNGARAAGWVSCEMENDGVDDGCSLVGAGRASCKACRRVRVEAWRGWRGERQQRAEEHG